MTNEQTKNNTMWKNKSDVTNDCIMCVLQYIKSDSVIYERDGKNIN